MKNNLQKRLTLYCLVFFVLIAGSSETTRGQSGRQTDAQGGQAGTATRTPPPPGSDDDDEVIRTRTEEVLLPISVRDERGRPVAGLSADNFFVYEKGVRQDIASFNRRRVPANIVLLLDASGSVFSQMRLIRAAAVNFSRGLMPEDRISVMQFADKVELLQDWTPATETKKIELALNFRYHPGEQTNFYEGLYTAAENQLRKVEGRRIIILLTDGIDTAARPKKSFAQALQAVESAEASVYVVSLTASLRAMVERQTGGRLRRLLAGGYDPQYIAQVLRQIDEAEESLGKLAIGTGGRMFLPLEETELSPAYDAIAEELRTQYIITYTPKPRAAEGEWRQIRVLVTPGGYDVAARTGYMRRP
ncbi:MAG: VWA domain-containing protein [Pyrinomonadaceae bacterium]|nr:VWA domain-containing protein [Pyrinomonadaceae bacterium]